MGRYMTGVVEAFGAHVPTFLAALAVLLGGWLLALLLSRFVGAALRRTRLDDRLAASLASDPAAEPPVMDVLGARIVFWVVMVFVLVAFLQVLGLGAMARPFEDGLGEVTAFLPNLLSAGLLALAGWILARLLRGFVVRVAERAGIDDALGRDDAHPARPGLARVLGDAIYGIVLLLFMVAVLETLGLEGVLTSLNAMLAGVLAFLPNLAAAALIVLVGWIFARLVRRVVENLVAAAGLDRLGQKARMPDRVAGFRFSEMAGLLAYALVLLPVGIAALNALRLEAVTAPASDMLERFLITVPLLFGAAILLALGFLLGRILGAGTTGLLSAAGFDGLVGRLVKMPAAAREAAARAQEGTAVSGAPAGADPAPAAPADGTHPPLPSGSWSPSSVVGTAVTVVVVLFAAVEALSLLDLTVLADVVTRFLYFAGDVVAGLAVFALGLLLAGWAADAIAASGVRNALTLARSARITIIVLVSFMALSQMGVADEIVVLAFGLLLGSAAVAMAIAFGVGGRELARAQLERWLGPGAAAPRRP